MLHQTWQTQSVLTKKTIISGYVFLDLQHYDSVKLFIKDNSINLFCMNMHILHKHVAVHDIYLSAATDHISLHI